MTFRTVSLVWPAVVVFVFLACGGSNGTTGSVGGSALCGVNGANQCGSHQQCDLLLGCVDCTANANCPAAAPHCLQGACVTCLANGDCGATAPACWASDHQCHPACTTSTTCPPDAAICQTTTGDCVGCTSASDCTTGAKICSAATQQCVKCATSGDCPRSAPDCLVREGRCVECLSNAECGTAAPICDPGDFHLPRRLHEQRRLSELRTLLRHHDVVVRAVSEQHPVRGDGDAVLQRGRPVRRLRERHELPDNGTVLPRVDLRSVPEQARLLRERTFVRGGQVPVTRKEHGAAPEQSYPDPTRSNTSCRAIIFGSEMICISTMRPCSTLKAKMARAWPPGAHAAPGVPSTSAGCAT